jgi:hypothetical protein
MCAPNGIAKATGGIGARRARCGRRGADEQMRAGSARISNISGAWAAVHSVRPMCVPNGIVKATGDRREKGVVLLEEGMRR